MKKMMTLCAALLLVPALAFAHGKATGIVKERMDRMVEINDARKVISAQFRQEDGPDPGAIADSARVIERHSGAAMTALFPPGSTMHSDAMPSVWTEPTRFSALAEDLRIAAATLARDADSGADTRAAFAAVEDACSACHDDYRLGLD